MNEERRVTSDVAFEGWHNDLLAGVRNSAEMSQKLRDNKEIMRDAYCAGFWACMDWVVGERKK